MILEDCQRLSADGGALLHMIVGFCRVRLPELSHTFDGVGTMLHWNCGVT